MTEEIDLNEYISDEQLKKFGHTKETFKGSNLEALLKAMLYSYEKTIQEETQRLMKKHSLSYGEARNIAINRVHDAVESGLKGEVLND